MAKASASEVVLDARDDAAAKRGARLETIPGTPPSLAEKPNNCSFAPRCTVAQPRCLEQLPANVEVGPGRAARCVLAEPVTAS